MMVIAVVITGGISFFGELIFRLFLSAASFFGGGRRSSGDGDRKGAAPVSPS